MIAFFLPVLLSIAAPGPCTLPDSMPAPTARMAGEGDADWCLKGADPFKAAGPDLNPPRQFVAVETPYGTAQIVRWQRSDAVAVPSGWRQAFQSPAVVAQRGAFREVLVQELADNLIVVTVNPAWRIGNAICSGEGGSITGYLPAGVTLTRADREAIKGWSAPRTAVSLPVAPAGEVRTPDDATTAAIASGGLLDPGNILCTLLIADGDGYRLSFRGPGGRPLPETDNYYADTRWRAVPAGELERHFRFSR